MNSTLNDNFLIYRISQTSTYIAIPYPSQRFIRQYVMEYQGLTGVPPDKRVKGILFQVLDHNCYKLSAGGKEEEIAINRLRFGTGYVSFTTLKK